MRKGHFDLIQYFSPTRRIDSGKTVCSLIFGLLLRKNNQWKLIWSFQTSDNLDFQYPRYSYRFSLMVLILYIHFILAQSDGI